ncbi:MAG: SDR family oxidoreductase [Patescibacteria group bacterium]|nr:SDR family oxidoreductase [Patescibacteria group bacterium]
MKILGIGLSGLVGSRVVDLLKADYEFDDLSISTGFDITDKQSITEAIISSNAAIVLHLAAKTDVDGCERDKTQGADGDAWRINVEGTRNVVEACQKSGKKIIYFSTDFVFNGEKEEAYAEEDIPDPINWYAKTKFEGEKNVKTSATPYVIVRTAYPYRAIYDEKLDFVRTILKKLKDKASIAAVSDHIMTPTFIDDIAKALDVLIKNEATGTFHVVGSQYISPFDAVLSIADTFGLDKSLVKKTTREEYFANRATRPFHLALKNDKIRKLGIKMKTFGEGLSEIRKQIKTI